MKKGIVILLVIGLVMMTQDFSQKTHHLENASNSSLDQYFAESDLEARNKSKFKSNVLMNKLSNSKTVLIAPKKFHAVLNCGYDVC